MTPTLDLARRLVACRGFRWARGMRDQDGHRIYAVAPFLLGVRDDDGRVRPECAAVPYDALPDLDDALTAGALPGMVREALGPSLHAHPDGTGAWTVHLYDDASPMFRGATETEAWIVAMESVR